MFLIASRVSRGLLPAYEGIAKTGLPKRADYLSDHIHRRLDSKLDCHDPSAAAENWRGKKKKGGTGEDSYGVIDWGDGSALNKRSSLEVLGSSGVCMCPSILQDCNTSALVVDSVCDVG